MNIVENLSKAIKETISNNLEEKTIKNARKQEITRNTDISNSEIELAQKLNAVEEYTIDRFEGKYAVLENRETGEMKNVEKDKLPSKLQEGNILNCINEKYFLNEEKTKEVENSMQERMNKLKKNI